MTSSKLLKSLVLTTAALLLYLGDGSPDAPLGLTIVHEAHAVVGAPLTPLSGAGVARRTTRRVVASQSANTAAVQQQQTSTAQQQSATAQQQSATAQQQTAAARPPGAPPVGAAVSALPANCKAETKSGVQYQNCGGVYYRAAFQGENLVYVVQ